MDIKRIAGALGAEHSGVDLARGLSTAQAAVVRRALLDHQLILLRGQDLTPQQFLDCAKATGEPVEYPAVRTHPETARKALFVSVAHTADIVGLTDAESAPLLQFLFEHQVKPEFTCRFAWEPNAIAFWDNRCVLHNPGNDYHGLRRVMHRITLQGDTPA